MSSTAVGCVVPSVLRSEKNEEPISSVQWEEGGGEHPFPKGLYPIHLKNFPAVYINTQFFSCSLSECKVPTIAELRQYCTLIHRFTRLILCLKDS